MKFFLAAAIAVLWTPCAAHATGKIGNILDVRQFGARGDGAGFDTVAIQKALDTAAAAGGGIVRVPAGTYHLQPIHLRTKTTLQLDEGATLRASDDPRDFGLGDPALDGRILSLINAKHLTDITITGHGVIDGSGARWWRTANAERSAGRRYDVDRPRLINMAGCQRVTVEGVTLQNSPLFHLALNHCDNVAVRNVTIDSPVDSPNTDGIDPANCHGVTISGCCVGTGDDGVAIKSFHADPAHPNAGCSDIVVRNCAFVHGFGVAIGSETVGGVSDVLVEHCTFEDTRYGGLDIKSGRDRGGVVQDIRMRDVRMRHADPALNILCYYPFNFPARDVPRPVTPLTPIYRHIHIENLTADCPREGAIIVGLPESPITDLTLSNVHISSPRGFITRDVQISQPR